MRNPIEVEITNDLSSAVPDECQTLSTWREWAEAHGLWERDPRITAVHNLLRTELERVPVGDLVVDSGSGEGQLRPMFAHSHYISVDFVEGGATQGWDFGQLDIVGDVNAVPLQGNSAGLAISGHGS